MIAAPSDPGRTEHKTNSLHGDLQQQRTVPNLLEIRSVNGITAEVRTSVVSRKYIQ